MAGGPAGPTPCSGQDGGAGEQGAEGRWGRRWRAPAMAGDTCGHGHVTHAAAHDRAGPRGWADRVGHGRRGKERKREGKEKERELKDRKGEERK